MKTTANEIVFPLAGTETYSQSTLEQTAIGLRMLTSACEQIPTLSEMILDRIAPTLKTMDSTSLLNKTLLHIADAKGSLARELERCRASEDPAAGPDLLTLLENHLVLLHQLLTHAELTPIPTEGHPLDPNIHTAVGCEPVIDPAKHRLISTEVRPGFRRGDTLLRPAEVLVSIFKQGKDT